MLCCRLPVVVLERHRRLITERRVAPVPVVGTRDEVEERDARLGVATKATPLQQLALQGCEEILAKPVAVGIAHRAGRRPRVAARQRPCRPGINLHPQPIGAGGAEVPIHLISRHTSRSLVALGVLSPTPRLAPTIPASRISRPTRLAPIRSPPACNAGRMRGRRWTFRLALQISLIRSVSCVSPARSWRRSSTQPCGSGR